MTTTTTTTKEKVKEQRKIDIFALLDTQALTRAERSYYEKHYKEQYKDQSNTIEEWLKIIKFIH